MLRSFRDNECRRAAEQHLASLQSEAAHAKKAADEALRLAQQQQREFATEKTKIEAILDEKWAKLIYVEREQLSSANAVIISLQAIPSPRPHCQRAHAPPPAAEVPPAHTPICTSPTRTA
jgi:hypothetical protein